MPYYPFAAASDDRSLRGAVLARVRNLQVERSPRNTAKGLGYYLTGAPGYSRALRPSSGNLIRGVFARPGVLDGQLFAVAGQTLYAISPSYVATALGTITGSDPVLFDALREVVVIVANGKMWTYNGTTLTLVTDADLSADLFTLAVLGQRVLTSARNTDQLEWSAVLDAATWPSDGFATSELSPDPLIANVVVGDELFSLGSATTQIWRAIGGADADAFDTFAGSLINKGCIARLSAVRVDAALFWLADDRCVYRAAGATAERIANRALEQQLASLTEAQIVETLAWTYTDGSKVFYILRPPVGLAHCYDVAEGQWSERTTYGADAYTYGFYTYAYDRHLVAGPADDGIYEMRADVYGDESQSDGVLERAFTAHVPAVRDTRIDSVGFDVKAFGQPLSGQGSEPELLMTYYKDGGTISSVTSGLERRLLLGRNGQWAERPTAWRFGRAGSDGFLIEGRITDPVGAAIHGVWVNEGRA